MMSTIVTSAYCRRLTATGTYLKMGMSVSSLKTPYKGKKFAVKSNLNHLSERQRVDNARNRFY